MSCSDLHANEIDGLLTYWNNKGRNTCYKNHKEEHNCSDCESTTLEVVFKVNNAGEIIHLVVIKDQIHCLEDSERDQLKKDMINSLLEELVFSDQFRHKMIKIRVGTALNY